MAQNTEIASWMCYVSCFSLCMCDLVRHAMDGVTIERLHPLYLLLISIAIFEAAGPDALHRSLQCVRILYDRSHDNVNKVQQAQCTTVQHTAV